MSLASVAIIGAGPAGLTAAYLLAHQDIAVTVLEADPTYVGGIARTAQYKGFRFDIGGHRFFSKSKEVEDFWSEILPNDMLERPRSSRIYYRGQYFAYPLKAGEALRKLGLIESTRCVLSYLKARAFPIRDPKSFEDWVTNQFGSRLFNIFFKTYTEKVWGMSCKEISADWAAQRIKGLSLTTAIPNALLPKITPAKRDQVVKTLIDSFRYPRKGPGMLWEACAEKVKSLGGTIEMGRTVVGCSYDAHDELWRVVHKGADGKNKVTKARHVISSAPLRELAQGSRPAFPRKRFERPPRSSTETSLPSCSFCGIATSSPITGSIFTTRASRSAASRTSSPGRQRWCPISPFAATAWSISVLKATASGLPRTKN